MTKKLLIKRLNGITREMRVDVLIIEFHQNNSLYARSPDPLSLSIGGVAHKTSVGGTTEKHVLVLRSEVRFNYLLSVHN